MPKGVYEHKGRKLSLKERKAISKRFKGKALTAEHRAKLRAAKLKNPIKYWLGREDKPKHTRATRRQMSLAKRGIKNPRYGCLPPHVNWTKYNGQMFRSTWEVRFAKALDRKGVKFKYESKTFDLGDTTYTPDFYLPEFRAYWEIKGWLSPQSRRKIELFRKLYPNKKLVLANKPVLKQIPKFFEMEI